MGMPSEAVRRTDVSPISCANLLIELRLSVLSMYLLNTRLRKGKRSSSTGPEGGAGAPPIPLEIVSHRREAGRKALEVPAEDASFHEQTLVSGVLLRHAELHLVHKLVGGRVLVDSVPRPHVVKLSPIHQVDDNAAFTAFLESRLACQQSHSLTHPAWFTPRAS